jgi:hypothetical protein
MGQSRVTIPWRRLKWISQTYLQTWRSVYLVASYPLHCWRGSVSAMLTKSEDWGSSYERWDFKALPGHPYRLFLSAQTLETLMQEP